MFRMVRLNFLSGLIALLSVLNLNAQDSPPQIEVTGDLGYCADAPTNIVTSVIIGDDDVGDNTLENVFIQISEGYQINQDLLSLDGTFPNISATWSNAQGTLTLNGPATFNEFEVAISNVVFETTQTIFNEDKFISINLSSANYLPSTGHYYVYVPDLGISWVEAEAAAESQVFFGIQGYLATLTSAEESQLAGEQSPGTGWIGATDAQNDGTWQWVTGPEAGEVFWIGQNNGTPQNGAFSFWNVGEPNNFNGDEDYAHITDPSVGNIGSWNDLPNAGDPSPSSPYYPKGYFVEYGGMPGDPEINLSASTSIITPRISLDGTSACGNSTSQLSVSANTPRVLWYETETSTIPINDGFTYDVTISETTTFWVVPLFNGCNTGTREPLTVTVFPIPAAIDIAITQCDDEVQDGLAIFGLNAYEDAITDNIVNNREVNFYEDAAFTISIDPEMYNSLSNPQTIYAEVIDTQSGCSNSSEVLLQTSTSNTNTAFLEQCDSQQEDGLTSFDLSLANDQVLANLPQDFEVTYYLTYTDALFQSNPLPISYTNIVPYNQTVFSRVDDNGSCYSIGQVNLEVIELPVLAPDAEVFYCLNSFPEPIVLNGGVVEGIPNNFYYNWSTGETTINIEVNEPGVYTVEVTPVDGCPKTRTITVSPSNVASIDQVTVNDLRDSNSITVEVTGDGTYEFALDDANGFWQTSNVFTNVEAGIYTVFIKDVKNDCGVVSVEVSVVGYPKFFTPNGDNVNEFWQLRGVSEQFQSNSKVFIFDRHGKLLYTLNSATDVWDGTFNGFALPTSDYWFSATLQDGRNFQGHFTLKR
ncbi:T9SS type B sorting domain-containing protein [Sediminibacter sp. Hel_I_10]|uniref:T9SS type B sorting domain-containing protein n=1 Tax=Sediminibacter sp. Hel_I_10 TaxID=1392490 RepID=UPI001E56BCE6|nr:T9SS type B sorting domain-containing protein [Sediminibacter sp. Hel_I_10]